MAELTVAAEHGLLRNRPFLALWSAQILSMTAANALTASLIVLVAELTKSNTSSSFLILLAVVPAVLFGVFAGVFVDRSDRKQVLIATNLLRALAVGSFFFLGDNVAAAYVVIFLVASVTVFFVPAEAATIPAIVRRGDLLAANSLFTFTFNGAFLLGFVILGPILIALAGFVTVWVVVAAMFAAAAVLCWTLPPSEPAREHLAADVAGLALARTRRGISEAFDYLRQATRISWALVYIAITYTLIAVAGALAPGYVREVLLLPERSVVLIVGPAGLGVVAGLLLLNVISRRIGHGHAIGVGLVVAFGALLVLAAARPVAAVLRQGPFGLGEAFPYFVAVVMLTAFVFGFAYALITVPSMTLIQEELPEVIRGRIFGVLNVLVSVFSLLPLVVVGPVADLWGVAPVFLGAAVLVAAVWYAGRGVRGHHREVSVA